MTQYIDIDVRSILRSGEWEVLFTPADTGPAVLSAGTQPVGFANLN